MGSIALATCAAYPTGYGEDEFARLLEAEWAVWDDPAVCWARYEQVVIRSTWDYAPRRAAFLQWTRSVTRLHNSASLVAWNTDKSYLLELRQHGISTVPTVVLKPGTRFRAPSDQFVVKPSVGNGSADISRFAATDLARALALADSIARTGRRAIVQPYARSVDDQGEAALHYFGGRFSHAVIKPPLLALGAGPSLDHPAEFAVAPCTPSPAQHRLGRAVVDWLERRFATPLYLRVDLVSYGSAPAVLEVEATEPYLFLSESADGAERFAQAVVSAHPRTKCRSRRTLTD